MQLNSITVSSLESDNNLTLRFQSGNGAFSRVFFITGGHQLYTEVATSLDYAVFGENPEQTFLGAGVQLSDSGGKTWDILRKKEQSGVLYQGRKAEISATSLLFQGEDSAGGQAMTARTLGRYQLSHRGADLFMSSLNLTRESDQINYRFLQEHIKNLLEACSLSLDHRDFGRLEFLERLMKDLEPAFQDWKILRESSGKKESPENKPAGDYRRASQELKDQVGHLHRMKELLLKLTHPGDGIETLRKLLLTCEKDIKNKLVACGLEEFNENRAMIDWNVPLQCLCYLNVLDQLIPALQMSLRQLKSFFQKTLDGLLSENGPVYSSIKNLDEQLGTHRKRMVTQLSMAESLLRKAGEGGSIWNRMPFGGSGETALASGIRDMVRESRGVLAKFDDLVLNFRKMHLKQSEVETLMLPLEEFLEQTKAKREALARHWKTLCGELSVPESVSLHDFLQYVMNISSLVILNQRARHLKEQLLLRKDDLLKLKDFIVSWYDLTGSQKVVCLNNSQMILNEAQNVVRYLPDKERKLGFIQENRLNIEMAEKEKATREEKRLRLLEQWHDTFTRLGLPKTSPDDERIPLLIEKYRLLKSLCFLQSHISGLNMIPAFTRDWQYEALCVWKLTGLLQNELIVGDLVKKLKDLPPESHHIIFIRDSELSAPLRKAGLGQVIPLWEARKPGKSGLPQWEETEAASSGKTAPPQKQRHLPGPKNRSGSDTLLSPQVQAVVELLNGGYTRSG